MSVPSRFSFWTEGRGIIGYMVAMSTVSVDTAPLRFSSFRTTTSLIPIGAHRALLQWIQTLIRHFPMTGTNVILTLSSFAPSLATFFPPSPLLCRPQRGWLAVVLLIRFVSLFLSLSPSPSLHQIPEIPSPYTHTHTHTASAIFSHTEERRRVFVFHANSQSQRTVIVTFSPPPPASPLPPGPFLVTLVCFRSSANTNLPSQAKPNYIHTHTQANIYLIYMIFPPKRSQLHSYDDLPVCTTLCPRLSLSLWPFPLCLCVYIRARNIRKGDFLLCLRARENRGMSARYSQNSEDKVYYHSGR